MPEMSDTNVMLLAAHARPFTAPGWLFELKYDGFRVLALKDRERVRRSARWRTRRY